MIAIKRASWLRNHPPTHGGAQRQQASSTARSGARAARSAHPPARGSHAGRGAAPQIHAPDVDSHMITLCLSDISVSCQLSLLTRPLVVVRVAAAPVGRGRGRGRGPWRVGVRPRGPWGPWAPTAVAGGASAWYVCVHE